MLITTIIKEWTYSISRRFPQMEKTSLGRVSTDTLLGSFRCTAWQSGLQVVVALSWETWFTSKIREQQWAIKSAGSCWPWGILPSLPIVPTKVRSFLLLLNGFLIIIVLLRERRESAQEGEGLRHRGNGNASGAGVPEQNRRWVNYWISQDQYYFPGWFSRQNRWKEYRQTFIQENLMERWVECCLFCRGSNQK